jgi:hypothetical protein
MTVARSRTLPPANTSSILSRTRSQPLSLLSIARLNIARSRRRPSICSRTRIVQTSFGFSGRFWPIRRPLFQGTRWRVGAQFSVANVVSDADPFHLSARSASTGCGRLTPKRRDAPTTDPPGLYSNGTVRPDATFASDTVGDGACSFADIQGATGWLCSGRPQPLGWPPSMTRRPFWPAASSTVKL